MTYVVGGTYREVCRESGWDQLFGSGLRAAAALRSLSDDIHLSSYIDSARRPTLDAYAQEYGIRVEATDVQETIVFSYAHGLATPKIHPPLHRIPPARTLSVEADVVLRFGMLEGDAVVDGEYVVYDPQSAYDPKGFSENGSQAEHLAVVVNLYEGRALTEEQDPIDVGKALLTREKADVAVLKLGGAGVKVFHRGTILDVPAFRTDTIFPIGSGDVFSAVFGFHWAQHHADPRDAALKASKAAAWYCGSRSLLLPDADRIERSVGSPIGPTAPRDRPPRVYLAGPFFTTAERWLIDEARDGLLQQGIQVFSPYHDVGLGPAEEVVEADLNGIDSCAAMLAVVDGFDAGTLFEVGYARARDLPVVALAQNASEEPLKMLVGTRCEVVDDFVSAVYRATWAALEN